jgi:hypothetical protein
MTADPTPGYVTLRGARAYNEAAFRRFLAADRVRAHRLHRALFLVLVSIQRRPGRTSLLPDAVATAVFRGLGSTVREVDLVGWFREQRVAAALLVQGPHTPEQAAAAQIAARVRPAVETRLSAAQARNLRIRVVRLGASIHH